MKNKIFLPLILINLFSCSSANQVQISQPEIKAAAKFDIFQIDQNVNTDSKNTYVVKVKNDDKGTSFLANIKLNENGYSIKASSGLERKKISDVAKIDIYLLQLTSAPGAGSDPLATVNVIASQLNIPKDQSSSSFNILFQNVPKNIDLNQYFIGLVLKDSSGKEIGKKPSTPWIGNTSSTASTLAISSSGVTVLPDMTVSNTSDLSLAVDLEDAVGATVDGGVYINDGNKKLPAVSAN